MRKYLLSHDDNYSGKGDFSRPFYKIFNGRSGDLPQIHLVALFSLRREAKTFLIPIFLFNYGNGKGDAPINCCIYIDSYLEFLVV